MNKIVCQMNCLVSDNLIGLSNCIFDENFIMTTKRINTYFAQWIDTFRNNVFAAFWNSDWSFVLQMFVYVHSRIVLLYRVLALLKLVLAPNLEKFNDFYTLIYFFQSIVIWTVCPKWSCHLNVIRHKIELRVIRLNDQT